MNQYTLGFMFDADRANVALILKKKPESQLGKWNGVGGKLESDELPAAGMVREFREETGLHTDENQWRHFANLGGGNLHHGDLFRVYCFSAFSNEVFKTVTFEDEKVEIHLCRSLPRNVMTNLLWLIPMALNEVGFAEVHI